MNGNTFSRHALKATIEVLIEESQLSVNKCHLSQCDIEQSICGKLTVLTKKEKAKCLCQTTAEIFDEFDTLVAY